MNTAELTAAIELAAPDVGARLFRNNSGVAKHVKEKKTWWVRYGVGPTDGGGGDLLGWNARGKFASIEVKVGRDESTPEQLKWKRWVLAGGGVAGEARSVEDALAILDMDLAKENPG